ncbi:MAG: hypothetical protein IJS81_09660 [Selenomonadaceae bacterium]|nr:hypothetical protein [Selenomonadaceae bacterium]
MVKNLSFAVALVFAVCTLLTGCGGLEKPQGAADNTIKVWAEMQGIGKSSQDIAAVTGVPKADIDKIYNTTKETLKDAFKTSYALNDENADVLVDYWLDTLVADEMITTKLKQASDTNPVVELTLTPIDAAGIQEIIRSDADLLNFMQTLEQLKADPAELQKALANDELQNIILQVVETKIVDQLTFKDPVTMDVKCQIVQGEDGKTHWGPADPNAVANFLKQQ